MRWMIVAALMLVSCAPAPPASHAAAAPAQALGDPRALPEVFWSFQADGPHWTALVDKAYGIDVTENGVTAPTAHNQDITHDTHAIVATAEGVRIEMTYGACTNDGLTYPLHATLTRAGHTLTGCAYTPTSVPALALRPWIDACLAASPRTRRLTLLQVEESGAVLVRLTDQHDGPGADCRVPLNGAPQITPRNAAQHVAGDEGYVFIFAPYEPTACGAELPKQDGTVDGWLEYPAANCAAPPAPTP